jgi:hypothetical protein
MPRTITTPTFRGIGTRPGVFASYVRATSLFDSMRRLYRYIDRGLFDLLEEGFDRPAAVVKVGDAGGNVDGFSAERSGIGARVKKGLNRGS